MASKASLEKKTFEEQKKIEVTITPKFSSNSSRVMPFNGLQNDCSTLSLSKIMALKSTPTRERKQKTVTKTIQLLKELYVHEQFIKEIYDFCRTLSFALCFHLLRLVHTQAMEVKKI